MEKKLQQTETAAKDLIKYHCPTFHFEWSRSKKFKGSCWYSRNLIRISKKFAEVNTFESMLLTVIHEIAHAFTHGLEKRPHGKIWQAKYIELGGNGLIYWSRSSETVAPKK